MRTRIGAGTSSSSDGLTEAEVDARVQAGVEDWAEEGNTDDIPAEQAGPRPRDRHQRQGRHRSPERLRHADSTAEKADIRTKLGVTGGGGGGGLDQAEVESLIRAGVADWAEDGEHRALIPDAKLPTLLSQSDVDARVLAEVADWAEEGNNDNIPATKLDNAPGLDEAEVDARVAHGVLGLGRDREHRRHPGREARQRARGHRQGGHRSPEHQRRRSARRTRGRGPYPARRPGRIWTVPTQAEAEAGTAHHGARLVRPSAIRQAIRAPVIANWAEAGQHRRDPERQAPVRPSRTSPPRRPPSPANGDMTVTTDDAHTP